jgi:NTE family protein
MKRKTTAVVLSGGANRGALQVGALRALFERGLAVDMLVGVSAGALNAAFLAPDPGLPQVERLAAVWRRTTKEDVYPGSRAAMIWRALRGEPSLFPNENFRRHLLANAPRGLQRFGDLARTRLYVVAAHRASGALRVFGDDPFEPIIDALMASSAIPPLLPPWRLGNECLLDGGLVTPLPVSVALARGATDLWAIQVIADSAAPVTPEDLFGVSARAVSALLARQADEEITRLQQAGGRLITVRGFESLLPWDYTHTEEMMAEGYRQAREQLERLPLEWPSMWQGVRAAVEGLTPRAKNGKRAPRLVRQPG